MPVNNAINSQQDLKPTDSPTFNTVTATGSFVGSLSGNASSSTTSTTSGSTSGNAATATALQNARTIGGTSFDGTANIVPQTITSASEAADTTCFPLFFTASGTQSLQPKNNASYTYNSSTNNLGISGITLSGSALSGTNVVIDIGSDSSFQDGNYITIAGGGRNLGLFNGGDVFFTYNLNYNTTDNTYKYASSAGASLIELSTSKGKLKYAASGTIGNTATTLDGLIWETNGDVRVATGQLSIDTAGKGLGIKSGANARIGTGAVLVGGTVTVNTTAVATGDIIFLSCTAAGGTQGIPRISAIVNATSFTITSSSGTDTSTYSWMIVRPT